MVSFPAIVGVVATPYSALIAQTAETGNYVDALTQLGIGGVLVWGGAVIYRRFEARADAELATHRAELAAERASSLTERAARDAAREELITLLLAERKDRNS